MQEEKRARVGKSANKLFRGETSVREARRMRALVTGGAGFIGSHLAQALHSRGVKVLALDNLSTGLVENLAWAKGAVEFVQGDICDRELVKKLVRGTDWVFHMGACASVPYSVEHPEKTNRENLDAVLALLSESREAGVKRIVFSSSSSVYGNLGKPAEESDAVNPLSPYALQKYAAERYVQMFHSLYKTPGVALRYFNVFGPRQSYDSPYSGVIARFCDAVLGKGTPKIFGTGEQSRDFVSVHDVVQANLLAAERNEALGGVFNIGRGESISVLELLRILNRVNGTNIAPEFHPARPGEILFSCANISAARRTLGFEPRVSLEEGLQETLQFYRDQRSQ
jgi:nucleoside-diphosphate-sugar epimerase